MIKLLHISDCHLGFGFINKSEAIRKKLLKSVRDSFINVRNYCSAQSIDILVIAGDLFDSRSILVSDEKFFYDNSKIILDSGTKVVYCSGNHDPNGTLKLIRANELDGFIAMTSDELYSQSIDIRGIKVKIVGSGYGYNAGNSSFAEPQIKVTDFPPKEKHSGEVTIGVCHLSLENTRQSEGRDSGNHNYKYNPTPLSDIEKLGYDYFAMGHIHIRQRFGTAGNIAYSGSLHGLNINETGDHGGYLVNIDEFNRYPIKVEEVNFANTVYTKMEVDISEFSDEIQFLESVDSILQNISGNSYVRLTVTGFNNIGRNLFDPEVGIKDSIDIPNNILDLEIDTKFLKPGYDYLGLKDDNTLLGKMLRSIDEIDESEFERIKSKYKLPESEDLDSFKSFVRGQAIERLFAGEGVEDNHEN